MNGKIISKGRRIKEDGLVIHHDGASNVVAMDLLRAIHADRFSRLSAGSR
jgi:hypothetical protein